MYRISLFVYIAEALEVRCTFSIFVCGGLEGGFGPDINLTASGARNVESLRTVMLKLCLIVPAHYYCHLNVIL
jgi:hypothetical protein